MTTKNKYKCDDHKLNIAYLGCVKAWIERHNAMLKFIRKVAYRHTEFEETSHISWDACELLKKIGEI